MTPDLIETVDQGIATLTMNRPEVRNALSRPMVAAMHEALIRLARDPSVRAVVLTGTGRAFCAGGDVKGFAAQVGSQPDSFEGKVHGLRQRMEVSQLLHEMPKPTLAVIPGPAAGAGLALALACDMRIAASDAKLTTAFAKVGLSGDFGGSYFLSHLIGAARARELYFTSRVVLADEAMGMGMVNRVAAAADLPAAALAFAQELAALPTIALGYMKKNLNLGLHATLPEVLAMEATHMIRTFETEDHKSAAQAFAQKETPRFHGR